MDLEIVVIIKGEIIHGDNHANEVTQCASGNVLWEEVRGKRSQVLIASLCGILVYNDETSSVTSKELAGKLPMVRSLLRKSLVSLTKDGSL